jgi:hypothetical protein
MAIVRSLRVRRSSARRGNQMSAIIGIAYSALKNVIVFGEASDSFTRVDENEMKATPTTPRTYVAVSLEC